MESNRRSKSREECVEELTAKCGEKVAAEFERLLDEGRRIDSIKLLRENGIDLYGA